jgi:ankyrin repeat protein
MMVSAVSSFAIPAKRCECSDPNCPAGPVMRKIREMTTNGDVWEIENVAGFTMATTAAVKNLVEVVKMICCKTVEQDMTEEQMLPEFKRVLQGKDSYGNTVMHYFALRKNDEAIAELLRVGGCMCIHNHAGQSAIDVRKTGELRMFDANIPLAVVVFKPSATPPLRIEAVDASPPSDKCEECVP